VQFTGEAGAKLYKDMINEWPDLRNLQEPKAFWEREWAHHGICSGFEAQRYFGKALALKRHLNIFQALTDHGIKPGAAHPRHTFERALQRRSIPPKSFAMRCGNKNGIKILIEIRVCTNEIHAIPCSRQLKDTCGGHGDIKLVSKIERF
jgi:ribonuclease T2